MSRIAVRHGFSNCGMHATIGMQTIVDWYVSSIKNQNIKG
jgi:hypothetical protein